MRTLFNLVATDAAPTTVAGIAEQHLKDAHGEICATRLNRARENVALGEAMRLVRGDQSLKCFIRRHSTDLSSSEIDAHTDSNT